MSTAAGGSGDGGGGGDRRSSHSNGKTTIAPPDKPKKMSTWERAMLRYLQGKHIDAVAAGQEPPFCGLYAPPADPSVADPPRTTNPQGASKKAKPSSSRHKDQGWLKFVVLYYVVVFHMWQFKFLFV